MKLACTVLGIAFSFICTITVAQTAGIEFHYGTGTYSMNNLKDVNSRFLQQSTFNFKQTSSFESRNSYGGTFVVGIGKFETGIDYRHYLTETEMIDGTEQITFTEHLAGKSYGLLGKYP